MEKVDLVLKEGDERQREAKWKEILLVLHDSATELPFSGKRIPAVINSRLSSFRTGLQQFDYPMDSLRVVDGSRNITVSPGGQTGLFEGIGRLDPHSYRPNEFFANNWIYEGLVEYGPEGTILPSLAASWEVESFSGGGQKYTFALRQGVTFHDGATWNCSVAKANFNVLAPPLTTSDWHGWYGLPQQIQGWSCNGDYEFVVTTKGSTTRCTRSSLLFALCECFNSFVGAPTMTHSLRIHAQLDGATLAMEGSLLDAQASPVLRALAMEVC